MYFFLVLIMQHIRLVSKKLKMKLINNRTAECGKEKYSVRSIMLVCVLQTVHCFILQPNGYHTLTKK